MSRGITGPIPNRSDQRVRTNESVIPIDKVPATGFVPRPDLGIMDPHPIVREFWDSMQASAQRKFFEPTDWVYAKFTMHVINEMLMATDEHGRRIRVPATKLQVVIQMLSSLMVTEGDRRRLRIEVERGSNDPAHNADVISLSDQIKARLDAM